MDIGLGTGYCRSKPIKGACEQTADKFSSAPVPPNTTLGAGKEGGAGLTAGGLDAWLGGAGTETQKYQPVVNSRAERCPVHSDSTEGTLTQPAQREVRGRADFLEEGSFAPFRDPFRTESESMCQSCPTLCNPMGCWSG